MRKKLSSITASLLLLTSLLILPYFVFAADIPSPMDRLENTAATGGYEKTTDKTTLITSIGDIINIALGLLGAIFITFMVYAGFTWLTANGDEKKVEKATGIIKTSIIGLVITLSSWAIWTFILKRLIS
jgi:lysylphosphatidylglycerol synthetase-like protein (DUF2156 family)